MISDELLKIDNYIYISHQQTLISEILCVNYDNLQEEHFEIKWTNEVIHHKYFWHDMMKNIKSHCNICDICQHVKTCRHCLYRELKFISKSQNIFKVIMMNFITELLSSWWKDKTYNVILIIIDVYMKYVWYFSCNKDITAKDLANLLYKYFFFFIKSLKTLVTNWESLFISKFWFSLCFLLNVKQHLSTAHHFQTDDQTEH